MNNLDAHWRDSARTPKFFVIDAQVFIPIVLCLFHFRLWTVCLCVVVAIILIVLNVGGGYGVNKPCQVFMGFSNYLEDIIYVPNEAQ